MLDKKSLISAASYNEKKDEVLWSRHSLPWPFSRYDAGSEDFAVMVCLHQMHEDLDADGKLGPATLRSVNSTFDIPLGESIGIVGSEYGKAIYELALSQVGVREHGRNSGVDVDKYIKSGAGDVDADPPWCQYFAYWAAASAAERLGGKTTSPRTGGVVRCWLKSEETGSLRILPADVLNGSVELQAGDQMCRVRNNKPQDVAKVHAGQARQGHTGIVERVDGSTVYTIEGNTNKAGSREGDGVYRKTIDLGSDVLIGFIRHGVK